MTGFTLEQILPHKPPMMLLTEFIEFNDSGSRCVVEISEASHFYDEKLGGVPSYVGIEYMAQTIAAYSGALNQSKGTPPKMGFLLGSRKYHPVSPVFTKGSVLTIQVEKVVEDSSGLSVFNCEITEQEQSESLVTAKLNVFQPEHPEAWLQENV